MGAVLAALFLEPGRPPGGDSPLDGAARIERILDSFYNDLWQRHALEREHLERHRQHPVHSRKWNQQEVYLDMEKRTRARAASREYLQRHSEWLSGPDKVGDVALHDLVAVQHYIDLDVEDLSLPEAERRNSDAFAGPDGNICDPFLRDATRCNSIMVDGQKFSFHARCAQLGDTSPKNPEEVQSLRKVFLDDLTGTMLRSLGRGGQANPLLVRAVTSAMSQSGLASVERACYSSQVVVSGGDQTVRYKLHSRGDGSWDVTLSVQKVRFEGCIICSQFFEDPVAVSCSPKSFVSKACTVRFTALEDSDAVRADVIKLRKETRLVNTYGSLDTGHALQPEVPGGTRPTFASDDPEPPADTEAEESTDTGGEDDEAAGPGIVEERARKKPPTLIVEMAASNSATGCSS